jgi:hypothetical protein
VEVTLDGGSLSANVTDDERPEAHVAGLLQEAAQAFGPDSVRKVHLTWKGQVMMYNGLDLDLDGALFTVLRDLPGLVSLALDGCRVVTARVTSPPWPHLRSLHVPFMVMPQLYLFPRLFPRVERIAIVGVCYGVRLSHYDAARRIVAPLLNLHTIDVFCLYTPTSHVVRLPALRRIVG